MLLKTRPTLPARLYTKRSHLSTDQYPSFEESSNITSKRRYMKNNGPVYIPTPIRKIQNTTSTATSNASSAVNDNSSVYDDQATNRRTLVNVSTAFNNSHNVISTTTSFDSQGISTTESSYSQSISTTASDNSHNVISTTASDNSHNVIRTTASDNSHNVIRTTASYDSQCIRLIHLYYKYYSVLRQSGY